MHESVEDRYTLASYNVITFLILTISYAIIIFKVKSNPPPQPIGSLASDRKLSVTLFIVTLVSILTILPWAIHAVITDTIWSHLPSEKTAAVLFYANSMVNPLIYAIRMQGLERR